MRRSCRSSVELPQDIREVLARLPLRQYSACMSVTVNLSPDEVAQIKRFTDLENEHEAVAKAAREFLRVAQLRELKAASGAVDYEGVGEAMEALELSERHSDK